MEVENNTMDHGSYGSTFLYRISFRIKKRPTRPHVNEPTVLGWELARDDQWV